MPFDIPYGTPITLDQAQKAIMAAVAEAKKHNWKMSITVVDPAGNLIAHATMDGTQYASIPISQAKARTAALFRRPSGVFQTAVNTAARPTALSLLALNGARGQRGRLPDRGRRQADRRDRLPAAAFSPRTPSPPKPGTAQPDSRVPARPQPACRPHPGRYAGAQGSRQDKGIDDAWRPDR